MYHDLARRLRKEMTDAERFAWSRLRQRQLGGYRFRRQVPLGPYIADFVCHEVKLILELDGGQHTEHTDPDAIRTAWLATRGYRVVRVWNHQVFRDWEAIESELWRLLSDSASQPIDLRSDG